MKHARYSILQILLLFFQYYRGNSEPILSDNIRPVEENEFPFIVSITEIDEGYDAELNHFCTGALVTKKHVLTAEHCLVNQDVCKIQVVIGSLDLSSGTKYPVKSWLTYEKWAHRNKIPIRTPINDIAIILLDKSVEDPRITPGVMAFKPNQELRGTNVTIAGWGSPIDNLTPRLLETVQVQIYPNIECESRIQVRGRKKVTVPQYFLCTLADPYAILECGDSGGPLISSDKSIVGVNKGICPPPDAPPYSKKVNIHVGLAAYRTFLIEATRV